MARNTNSPDSSPASSTSKKSTYVPLDMDNIINEDEAARVDEFFSSAATAKKLGFSPDQRSTLFEMLPELRAKFPLMILQIKESQLYQTAKRPDFESIKQEWEIVSAEVFSALLKKRPDLFARPSGKITAESIDELF